MSLAANGSGSMTSDTSSVSVAQTGVTITFSYVADSNGGLANGKVAIVVPGGWSAPSTDPHANGFTTSSTGFVSIPVGSVIAGSSSPAGHTVLVTGVNLTPGSNYLTITYGDIGFNGQGARVPTNTGTQQWLCAEKSSATDGGGLLPLASGSPTIAVLPATSTSGNPGAQAPDGAGTVTCDTIVVSRGTGQTLTFTYTASGGSLSNGAITCFVPGGWSLPSTNSHAAGYTTSDTGFVQVSGQTITVSGITIASGATVSIVYGNTAGGGPGAVTPGAPLSVGAFLFEERSSLTGYLEALSPLNLGIGDTSGGVMEIPCTVVPEDLSTLGGPATSYFVLPSACVRVPALPIELTTSLGAGFDANFCSVAWAPDQHLLVAADYYGNTCITADLVHWTWTTNPFSGPGQIVAGGYTLNNNGTSYANLIYDAVHKVFVMTGWAQISAPWASYGPPRYQQTHSVATSPDGVTWTLQTTPWSMYGAPDLTGSIQDGHGFGYSPKLGMILAAAPHIFGPESRSLYPCGPYDSATFNSNCFMMKSLDGGVTWTDVPGPDPDPTHADLGYVDSITWCDGIDAWAISVGNLLYLSHDGGNTWSGKLPQAIDADSGQAIWSSNPRIDQLASGGIYIKEVGLFVSPVGSSWTPTYSPGNASVAVSPSGVDGEWTYHVTPADMTTPPNPQNVANFAWSPTLSVVVGACYNNRPSANRPAIIYSPDGVGWATAIVTPWDAVGSKAQPWFVIWCDGLGGTGSFVIVGYDDRTLGANRIMLMSSPDGLTWTGHATPADVIATQRVFTHPYAINPPSYTPHPLSSVTPGQLTTSKFRSPA